MGSVQGCGINIITCSLYADIFPSYSRRLIVAQQPFAVTSKGCAIIRIVPKVTASHHDGLSVLDGKLHSKQRPLVEVDRHWLNHGKPAKRTALICPCRIEYAFVRSLYIIQARE